MEFLVPSLLACCHGGPTDIPRLLRSLLKHQESQEHTSWSGEHSFLGCVGSQQLSLCSQRAPGGKQETRRLSQAGQIKAGHPVLQLPQHNLLSPGWEKKDAKRKKAGAGRLYMGHSGCQGGSAYRGNRFST